MSRDIAFVEVMGFEPTASSMRPNSKERDQRCDLRLRLTSGRSDEFRAHCVPKRVGSFFRMKVSTIGGSRGRGC